MPPKSGDRIVLDAQTFIDYFLLVAATHRTERSQAAEALLGSCCVALYSRKLRNEFEGNVHHRGLPIPQQSIARFFSTGDKLQFVPTSKLDATPVHPAILKHVNTKDQHVAHLALCGRAAWLLTTDSGFLRECSTPAVSALFTALDPAQVLAMPSHHRHC